MFDESKKDAANSPAQSLSETIANMKRAAIDMEVSVAGTSSYLEKMKNLMSFSDPVLSTASFFVVFVFSLFISLMFCVFSPNQSFWFMGLSVFTPEEIQDYILDSVFTQLRKLADFLTTRFGSSSNAGSVSAGPAPALGAASFVPGASSSTQPLVLSPMTEIATEADAGVGASAGRGGGSGRGGGRGGAGPPRRQSIVVHKLEGAPMAGGQTEEVHVEDEEEVQHEYEEMSWTDWFLMQADRWLLMVPDDKELAHRRVCAYSRVSRQQEVSRIKSKQGSAVLNVLTSRARPGAYAASAAGGSTGEGGGGNDEDDDDGSLSLSEALRRVNGGAPGGKSSPSSSSSTFFSMRVHLVAARGLPFKALKHGSLGIFTSMRSKIYADIFVEPPSSTDLKFRTGGQERSPSPQFREEFQFDPLGGEARYVVVVLTAKSALESKYLSNVLGQVVVPLEGAVIQRRRKASVADARTLAGSQTHIVGSKDSTTSGAAAAAGGGGRGGGGEGPDEGEAFEACLEQVVGAWYPLLDASTGFPLGGEGSDGAAVFLELEIAVAGPTT